MLASARATCDQIRNAEIAGDRKAVTVQAQQQRPIRLASVVGVVLVAALAAIYMVSQTLRNSIGVIAPNLAAEIGLSAGQLGLLSSVFFIAFASAQVPLGVALDRFGPKLCMLVCTAIAVTGAGLFAAAATPAGLIFARVLIGLGCSCYLMAPLAFYARRFPPERFATLAGIQLGIGTIGTMVATAPLAFSTAAIGWRMTFLLMAGGMLVTGALVAFAVPSDRGGAELARHERLRENLAGTLAALRTPSVARLFLMHLAGYSGFVLIVGLWGGPYLTHHYGYGLKERGDLLLLAAGGQALGVVLYGPMERWLGSHKIPVLVGSGSTAALLLLLAAFGTLPLGALVVWLLALGVLSAYSPVLIGHGKTLFPPALIGRGMTLLNIGTMAGVFLSQTVTGIIIDIFPAAPDGAYPLSAYRLVFALQSAWITLALVPYFWTDDPLHRK